MNEERGSTLLIVLMLVMVLSFVLMTIGGLLGRKLFQLRKSMDFERENVSLYQSFDGQVEGYLRAHGIDTDVLGFGSCFTKSWDAIAGFEKVRIWSVDGSCYGETYRKVFYFDEGMSAEGGVYFIGASSVLVNEKEKGVLSEIKGYELVRDGGWVLVIYTDTGIYQYALPVQEGNELFGFHFLEVSSNSDFYMILEGVLWRLPKEGGDNVKVVDLGLVAADELLVSYLLRDELALLIKEDIGLGLFRLKVLRVTINGLYRYPVGSVSLAGHYRVDRVDLDGVLLIGGKDEGVLFALNWEGMPRWGKQYEWVGRNMWCGVGAQTFEPIEGYIVGCQRKNRHRI